MKNIYKLLPLLAITMVSCNKFLDREPLTDVKPDQYFNTESDLANFTLTRYNFPTHNDWNAGTFIHDNHTDNQAAASASRIWKKGQWRVPSANSKNGNGIDNDNAEDYAFNKIREINYFLEKVEPKVVTGEVKGNTANINHYLGEAYFLRAYQYFIKLRTFGDYPIITKVLPEDDKNALIEASKRKPRNEVARFILSDLDKAITLLKSGNVENKNRISKEVAHLFRSRVALYEGTWLKYHQGTAFVPGGSGWTGATHNPGFSININSEIDFFLTEAMASAKIVADAHILVENNHNVSGVTFFENPYFKMFGDLNMSGYSEVLLWRQYNPTLGIGHHTMHYLNAGAGSGYTRGFVDTFVMANGLPIYDAGSGYRGDDLLTNVKINRDERLQLFLRVPGDYVTTQPTPIIAKYPNLVEGLNENKSVTGYEVAKGLYDNSTFVEGANLTPTGAIVFRATEAYLNYIEASYVKNNTLDATALTYWKTIRKRAGIAEDPYTTINATDLSRENDWAVYSAGNMVDRTLYNIRRERRCEFIAEGMRYDDLKRWRALDQVRDYQIEGINFWTSVHTHERYIKKDKAGNHIGTLLVTLPNNSPVISAQSLSVYVRPYQIVQANNEFYNGYTWTEAHYLSPIPYNNFIQSPNTIYQNPGWPIQANGTPN